MEQITMEVIKVLVLVGVFMVAYRIRTDLLPLIMSKLNAQQLQTAKEIATTLVYMAAQEFKQLSGKEKKDIVKDSLKTSLQLFDIDLPDRLIDNMIEAAYKGMKIAEEAAQKKGEL